jgi:hypothetical protein
MLKNKVAFNIMHLIFAQKGRPYWAKEKSALHFCKTLLSYLKGIYLCSIYLFI